VPTWRPKLATSRATPLYQQLIDAMRGDIESGKLAPGTRLPPQRNLAHALSISVGAVTRAYDEAADHGLVVAHVGRGTFVIDRTDGDEAQEGPIDLSINIAPIAPAHVMAQTIAAMRRPTSWAERLNYQPACGLDVDRQAGAAWLNRTGGFDALDWRTLICCSGAQNAMAIALSALCVRGDVVLCEAATFSGAKALAAHLGFGLHGVAIDAQGALPESLDRAAAATGARVFYTVPTLQNPTARTMDRERRNEIVKIARARDLWIIEDDVYAPYARHLGLPHIAAMAPERTLYVSSLSKILSPGLRAGLLVAPAGEVFDRCVRAMRALMHSPAGVSAAIATDWITSGRADELARAAVAEASARTAITLAALKGVVDVPQAGTSLHLWLPMPEIDAEHVVARAWAAGLRLSPPGAFAVPDSPAASGVRLCIGSAASRKTLGRALSILTGVLKGEVNDQMRALL